MGAAAAKQQAFGAIDERVSGRMRKALLAALDAFFAGDQVDALSVVAVVNGRVYALSRGGSPLVHHALGVAQQSVQQQALARLRFDVPSEEKGGQEPPGGQQETPAEAPADASEAAASDAPVKG